MAETTEILSKSEIKQSIARVELFTDAELSPEDWRLVIHFEDGIYDETGKLLKPTQFGTRRVERRFGDIKDDVITGSITVEQLAGLIQKQSYAYRAIDVATQERDNEA